MVEGGEESKAMKKKKRKHRKMQKNAEKPEETLAQCRERENSPQSMHSTDIG